LLACTLFFLCRNSNLNSFASWNIVDGNKTSSDISLHIQNPATRQVIASVPVASTTQFYMAVESAARALPGWSSTPVEIRCAVLQRLGNMVNDNLESFISLVIQEVGKARELAYVYRPSCHYPTESL